jgi:hypothetical protein
MKRGAWAVGFTCAVACLPGLAAGCSSSSGASDGLTACASSSDCAGGAVCGFSNTVDAGTCSAARGLCVKPANEQPTNLCGCGGESIVYYWSGVIMGEKGFPPCGDAAIAPSSNDVDATSEAMADGEAGASD